MQYGVMVLALRKLDGETWGNRMQRARRQAELTVRGAAALLTDAGYEISHTAITRLESEREAPAGHRRMSACLALLAYGLDPDELDVGDMCRLLDVEAVLGVFEELIAQSDSYFTESRGRSRIQLYSAPLCATRHLSAPRTHPRKGLVTNRSSIRRCPRSTRLRQTPL